MTFKVIEAANFFYCSVTPGCWLQFYFFCCHLLGSKKGKGDEFDESTFL